MNQLQLEPYAQLPSEDVGRLVTFGIGADDLLYVVLDPDWVYGPELQPAKPYVALSPQNYLVYRFESGEARLLASITGNPFEVHHIQPIEDDRILLVGARCYWLGGRADQNARIYRGDGTFERSFTLGDGIAGLAVTPDGLIWTSYWDEGVYGNLGLGAARDGAGRWAATAGQSRPGCMATRWEQGVRIRSSHS